MTLDRRTALAVLVGAAACPALAARPGPRSAGPATIWANATAPLDLPLADRTVRLAVRATAGADRVRVRLSNAFGTSPLVVRSLHIGLRIKGAAIMPGSNRQMAFIGGLGIAVPPGGSVISDPVTLPVEAQSDLLLSVAISGSPGVTTGHLRPKDDSYLSAVGDHGALENAGGFPETVPHWLFADALIGEGRPNVGSVAVLGDSITDSGGTPRGSYQGWVDLLARRLAEERPDIRLGLVNAGISGNRLAAERPGSGPSALARLDRDVLSHAGVHTLILLEGINDIYGTSIDATGLIRAHAQVALRARMAGLRVIGGTLLPTRRQGFTPEREQVRSSLNAFIRASALYDHVIDFEAAVRDRHDSLALAPVYDSGDHLHPSSQGFAAMAAAVPLDVLYP